MLCQPLVRAQLPHLGSIAPCAGCGRGLAGGPPSPAQAHELSAFKLGTTEVRVLFEKAVVSNAARVVEEVRVSREVHEREEVIEDKLRRKEVDVQRMAVSQERECAFATGQ